MFTIFRKYYGFKFNELVADFQYENCMTKFLCYVTYFNNFINQNFK